MITDIIILIIIVVMAWTGWRRGLLMSVLSFAMTLISLAAVWFLIGPASRLLEKLPLLEPLAAKIDDALIGPMQTAGGSVAEAVADLGLPPLAESLLTDRFTDTVTNETAWQELSALVFRMTLSAGLFLLLFVIVMVLVILIGSKLTKLMDHLPLLGTANRFAGLLINLLLIILVIHAIIYAAALLSPLWPAAGDLVQNSRILSWFYETELWQGLLDTIFS